MRRDSSWYNARSLTFRQGVPVRLTHLITVTSALAGVLGCSTGDPVAPARAAGAPQATIQGLEQTVQLFPAEPSQGEQLRIVSVVVNKNAAPTDVVSRICGLDTGGDLDLTGSGFMCAGYSMYAELAPGESVAGNDVRVVTSAPGSYTLRVRHLLLPDTWVEVPVVVR